MEYFIFLHILISNLFYSKTLMIPEPGLLEELARRVEAAEAKFESANLDIRLTELEDAKKRQVTNIIFR